VPDVHFVVDLDDKSYESQLPIMAFAALHPHSSWNSTTLLVPDWTSSPPADAAEATADPWSGNLTRLAAVGGQDLAAKASWTQRSARVVWRGSVPSAQDEAPRARQRSSTNGQQVVRTSSQARLNHAADRWGQRVAYVNLSRAQPEHFDVSPTSDGAYLSREAQCRYRHILSLNGDCCHVSHGRLKWAMACGAVAIWAQPLWTLHWHHLLEPGVHFLTASSAEGVASCAAHHRKAPHCALDMARRGHALVSKYLTAHATRCYWATLLRGWAHRMPVGPRTQKLAPAVRTIDDFLRSVEPFE
jgi:hypothetical protein